MDGQADEVEALSFEQALDELEQIVERLEQGHGTLDDAIAAYERGTALKRHCQRKLDEARMKVDKIRVPESGAPSAVTDLDDPRR